MITLSRNTPVTLIVGVAGFLGSHLGDTLLEKGVQVVGVDNLESGSKENLAGCLKDKKFHFFQQGFESLNLEVPRLDYAFFTVAENNDKQTYRKAFDNFLDLCHKHSTKIVLVSSIDLYENGQEGLQNLRLAEKRLAEFATENKANARVVRLGAVFGPRMHFGLNDPIFKLIHAALRDELQKETIVLDFTTRALYVSDTIDLLIKAVMHGGTAQKIYDGVSLHPLKIAEVKQVLLDPIWHETKGFIPTELPPWPTPNLIKTEKELVWQPKVKIVTALKETLHFFRTNPLRMVNKKIEEEKEPSNKSQESSQSTDENTKVAKDKDGEVREKKSGIKKETLNEARNFLVGMLGIALITYALIYPLGKLGISFYQAQKHLILTLNALGIGDLSLAENEINQARQQVLGIKTVTSQLQSLQQVEAIQFNLQQINQTLNAVPGTIDVVANFIEGEIYLEKSLKIISGNKEGDLKLSLNQALMSFAQAEKKINNLPSTWTKDQISFYQKVISQNKALLAVLPAMLNIEGQANYLVLLNDNEKLRPGGGVVKAYAKVTFLEGRLKEIKAGNIEDLDKKLVTTVDVPSDLKKDLGQKTWTLAEVNFDKDGVKNSQMAEWFYQKETGQKLDGVVNLDLQAIKILSPNLSSKELNAKTLENFLNNFFFLDHNFVEFATSIQQALLEKHLMLHSINPTVLSYFSASYFSKARLKEGNFIAFYDTNIGDGSFTLVPRTINLQTTIDGDRKVSHKLNVSYNNQNISTLKDRFKIYLPAGTRLTKANFEGQDILTTVSSFADMGQAGYSMLLNLPAKEQKNLILEFQEQKSLPFEEDKIKFNLNLVKQAGTNSDPLNFKLFYPAYLRVEKTQGEQDIPQQVTFSTTLNSDKNFEVLLQRLQ